MPLGALGEELGWRGYLNKRLNARLGGLASSLLAETLQEAEQTYPPKTCAMPSSSP